MTDRAESGARIATDPEVEIDLRESSEKRQSLDDMHTNFVASYRSDDDSAPVESATVLETFGPTEVNSEDETNVRYFLVDDSPMAKFSRSVKWAYQKLPVGGGGAVLVLSELESMAARQQREIAQQRRLLEQREARLAVLRGTQEPAQQDRLARLRHRLDQQQSKLNRLRLLRSQTDQSRANNATLTSDLDCIRALFNEKEKELSLAVAKVEELTRQLEELRGRHKGGGNGPGGAGPNGQASTPASAELEKLRRELMYRNKMNEQQNQVVSQQRLALAQRQAEMASIDARIAQLQGRLQRKRALNQRLSQQLVAANRQANVQTAHQQEVKHDFNSAIKQRPAGNIAAIEPYSHIPNDNDFNLNKNDPKYQTLPYNTKFTANFKPTEDDVNKNKIQHSASASQIAQRSTFQQFGQQIAHSQSQSHIQGQSQVLGQQQSQQQQQQPQQHSPQAYPAQIPSTQTTTTNNTNNNNNPNNPNNNQQTNVKNSTMLQNAQSYVQESQNRVHGHQQMQHPQMGLKQAGQQHSSSNSSNSSLTSGQSAIGQQTGNHRNLANNQKPVSSVAPSFPVKSPIYQTSSTKIHPVMPQTLSLIGRGHCATTTTSTSNNNNAVQGALNSGQNNSPRAENQPAGQTIANNPDNHFSGRHIFGHLGQSTGQFSAYRSLNPSALSINQPSSNVPHNPEQSKFDAGKNHELGPKIEHLRFETPPNFIKHDNQKYEHNGGGPIGKHFEQIGQKNENNSNIKLEEVKYDSGKSEHNSKFEQNWISQQQQQQQQQIAPFKLQEQHESLRSTGPKYELNSQHAKHEQIGKFEAGTNFSQFANKQQQQILEGKSDNSTKPKMNNQQQQAVIQKLDFPNKFESGTKIMDSNKPFDLERNKNESERKTLGNFGDVKIDDKTKPALPPKPIKPNPPPRLTHNEPTDSTDNVPAIVDTNKTPPAGAIHFRSEKEEEIPPIPTSEPPESPIETQNANHQIIKARPLALKKAPLSEQPRLRYAKSNVHVSINRRIEMPPAFLFPETEIPADLMQTEQIQPNQQQQTQKQQQQQQQQETGIQEKIELENSGKKSSTGAISEDLTSNDKLEDSDIVDALNVLNIEDKLKAGKTGEIEKKIDTEIDGKAHEVMRRKKGNLKSTTGKVNLSRRVSFDPLALLLDASLEGELELVKKTAKEVANPSSANDEGITALHNAICAGHLEIVKFLVEFGCDVNAQDSDGWTPLHCAASCNNLAMVRFLVEHGACIFATTLSDHETAAEKCEEDEEGFDRCSEYLYSVQEKLGIMNNGQVYAVFDYDAQHSDELTLKNSDLLIILRKGDDNEREWWWSKLGHREGYVPRNLLGLYPRVQPTKAD